MDRIAIRPGPSEPGPLISTRTLVLPLPRAASLPQPAPAVLRRHGATPPSHLAVARRLDHPPVDGTKPPNGAVARTIAAVPPWSTGPLAGFAHLTGSSLDSQGSCVMELMLQVQNHEV
ncbi:hypothetical protein GQ55_2G385500 [Panicum hallii var. hallii]|uniref:Uncharacterized protein n=1 Tax=Panicum hallii var. hallii TaxID=1504633 RepID=A0A2T7EWX1_9POAL|nr:hypothetical protein GQ55_2G385500 [Panicum hallii var. hallii]